VVTSVTRHHFAVSYCPEHVTPVATAPMQPLNSPTLDDAAGSSRPPQHGFRRHLHFRACAAANLTSCQRCVHLDDLRRSPGYSV
jgi:hypothetical protein